MVKQRRFQRLFVGLVALSVFLGILIVPVEAPYFGANIHSLFDGIWWSAQTVTSVGYGDVYPVTFWGRIIGIVLEVTGVLAFGLLVSMVTVTLGDAKDKYYRHQLNERLDMIEKKIDRIEKQEQFVVKAEVENGNGENKE